MRSNRPLLSVLVPAYNAANYIDDCVRSLLAQSYDNIELLICDDGSTDDTWSALTKFEDPRISLYRNQINIGKNQTCSFLLEKAMGEFVTVHDADDLSVPCRFERQLSFLVHNPDYVMCGTNFISFLDNGKVIAKSSLQTDYSEILQSIGKQSQLHGPTVVVRHDIIPLAGGLYRYFTPGEDIDFIMRVAEKFKVCNLPGYYYYYRHNCDSMTNNVMGYGTERLALGKLLYHLAEERRITGGTDSLMVGDMNKLSALLNRFKLEFQTNPDLPLRTGVFRLIHMHMYRNAVKLAWMTLRRYPRFENLKCFSYSLIQYVIGNYRIVREAERIDLTFLK